jgi:hypothetical protein
LFGFTFAPKQQEPTVTDGLAAYGINLPKSDPNDTSDQFNKNPVYLTKSDAKGEYGFYRKETDAETAALNKIRSQVTLSRSVEGTKQKSWMSWILSKLLFKDEVRYKLLGDLLYRYTKEHCERVEWAEIGLPETFASWFSVSLLHVWVLLVRTRTIENETLRKAINQRIIDNFFIDIERGIVVTANVTNPIIVGKTNKMLLKTYYGSLAALDEAFLKGDAQLADALYRNLFAFDTERCSVQKLEAIVRYLRRALYKLDHIDTLPFLTGQWRWEEPPIMPGSSRKPSTEPLIKLYHPFSPSRAPSATSTDPHPLERPSNQ